jgi:hypothetical protein
VGGVAVAVSIAMAANWLTMAELGRRVTGLTWTRFIRAQVPGALLAVLIGALTLGVAKAARASNLGTMETLIASAVVAVAVTGIVLKLEAELFLGQHGTWATRRGLEMYRQVLQRFYGERAAEPLT